MDELCLKINDYYVGDLSALQITGDLEILHPLGKLNWEWPTHPINPITSQSKHYVRKELNFH